METREQRIARRDREIDAMIDRFDMTRKCQMPREEIHRMVQKGMVLNNLAFILADVANTFLLDCEHLFTRFGVGFGQSDKQNFNRLVKKISEARKCASIAASPIYHLKMGESQNACADSDWWYSFIKLVDDRLGDDPRKTNLLLEYLLHMPSEVGLFKVKYEDFKR